MKSIARMPHAVASRDNPSDLMAQIRPLLPLIEANAELAERQRKPVDCVIEALKKTDVFRAFVPARWGGLELDLQTFLDIGIVVGEACTSTGWITTFYMEHNWLLSQFPEATQAEIFSEQPFVLAPASISPTGKAQRVDGGFILDGRWAWGTGIMHADWVFLNGMVAGDKPEPRLFLTQAHHVEIEDTWHVAGMSGTGSNDMIAKQLVIPERFSEPLGGMCVGRGSGVTQNSVPIFRAPMVPLQCLTAAAPAVGAARRALSLFRERIQSRVLYGSQGTQSQQQAAHIRLGTAASHIEMAETQLRQVAREVEQWCQREDSCPHIERARMRLQIANAVRTCRDSITRLMEASGAGAHMKSSPMQRLQRDINTLSCHTVFDLDIGSENLGRMMLGLKPATSV